MAKRHDQSPKSTPERQSSTPKNTISEIFTVDPRSKTFNLLANYSDTLMSVGGVTEASNEGTKEEYRTYAAILVVAAMDYLRTTSQIDLTDPQLMNKSAAGFDTMLDAIYNPPRQEDGSLDTSYNLARELCISFIGKEPGYRDTRNRMLERAKTPDIQLARVAQGKADRLDALIKNPNSVRRMLRQQLQKLDTPEVRQYLEQLAAEDVEADENSPTDGRYDAAEDVLTNPTLPLLLDYEILPEGTQIGEITEVIVDRAKGYETVPEVEMERISTVLLSLREHFGTDRTYFARGSRRGNTYFSEELQKEVFEDYVILVIKRDDGKEDAIAISPIAQKHAGYIVRSDVSAEPWENVLGKEKWQARGMGARSLRFSHPAGTNKFEEYIKKVKTLFACDPAEFGPEHTLRRGGDGEYQMRCRPNKRTLHKLAQTTALLDNLHATNPDSSPA